MRGGRKGIWINDGWKIPIYDEKYKRTYSRSSKNPTQKKHKDANGHHSQLMKTGVKENNCWEFPGGQVAGSLPSNSRSEGSVPCGKQIPHDVWPSQKKIFLNWAIVKCLEKKGQDTPTEQKITIYFWSETMQTIGQQNDAVKLQKKIKSLPCPTAWSSIACQKRNRVPAFRKHWSLGTAGKHHSGNERFWKWWMHGWIWKIFVFILKFLKKVMNCFKPN